MKELLFKFCEKLFTGAYSIKISKKPKYTLIPKVVPIFLTAFLVSVIGVEIGEPIVKYIGHSLIGVGVFGFFYYHIFPSRRPKKD